MNGIDRGMGDALFRVIDKMTSRPINNYVLPGLTSSLVGGGYSKGNVRLLESDRATREWVVPHSHRFDFACLVLAGIVENILFVPSNDGEGEAYVRGSLIVGPEGGFGNYRFARGTERLLFKEQPDHYEAGDFYEMTSEQIHSIRFSRGARVLFFEGPPKSAESHFLEPWCNGKPVPTFDTAKWMFEQAEQRTPHDRNGGKDNA